MIDTIFNNFGAVIGSIIVVFLFILAMLWFLLPLILYQIRNRLDELISETKQTKSAIIFQNSLLSERDQVNK